MLVTIMCYMLNVDNRLSGIEDMPRALSSVTSAAGSAQNLSSKQKSQKVEFNDGMSAVLVC